MTALTIPLGPADRLKQLYSYPNVPGSDRSLADTVLHWFRQTLQRDGLDELGARATVRAEGEGYFLDLKGPPAVAGYFPIYADRLPKLLDNGWTALTQVVPRIKADGKWDPEQVGWRFFLPLGLAMARQRSLQFFHYPPIRLLDPMQDYLDDPVPVRWEELLEANGVSGGREAWLYETVMDATPIAAPDDQGTKGLIPISYFHDYQRAQVALLLNTSSVKDGYTVPVVVYGKPANATFSELYGVQLGVNVPATAEIIPGKKTPVLGANHPYRFYAQAQVDAASGSDVGAGKIVLQNCRLAASVMVQDLVVAAWQRQMADDPTQDPKAVLDACTKYWRHPDQAAAVCALVRHQGSLSYPDPKSLKFKFNLTLGAAADLCARLGNDPCAGAPA